MINHTIQGRDAFRRGSIAIALCEALERAGRSVEIVGATLSISERKNKPTLATTISIKRAGDCIDSDRLAFMLSHPAVPRRLHMGLLEMQSDSTREALGDGYGICGMLDAEDVSADIVIPDSVSESWIFDALRAQGVEIAD